jgi:hypothetical protein
MKKNYNYLVTIFLCIISLLSIILTLIEIYKYLFFTGNTDTLLVKQICLTTIYVFATKYFYSLNKQEKNTENDFIYSYSFGAMIGIPWWSVYMKLYWGFILIAFMFMNISPVLPLLIALFFGGTARAFSYKYNSWASFEEYKIKIKKIEKVSIIIFLVNFTASIIFYLLYNQKI